MEYIIQTQNLSKRYFNHKGIINKKSPKEFVALDRFWNFIGRNIDENYTIQ